MTKILLKLVFVLSVEMLVAQPFEFVAKLKGHSAGLSSIADYGSMLVTGDESGIMKIWNFTDWKLKQNISGHSGKISQLTFSEDGKFLVSAGYDGYCKVWSTESWREVAKFENTAVASYADVQGKEVTFGVIEKSNRYVYYGGYNMEVLRGDLSSGSVKSLFKTTRAGITSGVLSKDEQHLIFGYLERLNILKITDNSMERPQVLKSGNDYDNFICEIKLLPQSNEYATWDYGGSISFWNPATKSLKDKLVTTELKGTSEFAFSPDEHYLITGNNDNNTLVWDFSEKKVIDLLQKHRDKVMVMKFSMSGKYLFTGSFDKTINIWRIHEPQDPVMLTENSFTDREIIIQKEFDVAAEALEVSFYDDLLIDGDIISVYFNNRVVLREYTLAREKKQLQLPLSRGNNTLIIHAHNVGSRPPNTIALELKQGNTLNEKFKLRSDMETSAAVKFNVND